MKSILTVFVTMILAGPVFAETYKMEVKGMSCAGCARMISKDCQKATDVESVDFKDVDQSKGQGWALVSVQGDAAKALAKMKACVSEAGHYEVLSLTPFKGS